MKKSLLFAAVAALAFSANAAITDYATVEFCDGKLSDLANPEFTEITEGAVLKCTHYEDLESLVPGFGYSYTASIRATNKTAADLPDQFIAHYSDNPTEAMAKEDPAAWGGLQLCFNNAVEGHSRLPVTEYTATAKPNDNMVWEFDNTNVSATEGKYDRTYNCSIKIKGETLNFQVIFHPEGTGVADIVANEGVAEYYNLQGQRVENPAKGLYIVKQNGKTSKMMLR